LVTAFKVLDMFIEWILQQNSGTPPPWQFAQKLTAIKGAVHFPQDVENLPWLRERLIGLYENVERLRSTVIHHRDFVSADGSLVVASSKKGVVGPPVLISEADLRSLVEVVVSVLRCVRGDWSLDRYRQMRLAHALDGLSTLHNLPALGQQRPVLKNARVYRWDDDEIEIDLQPIRAEAARNILPQDVVFRLRVVVLSHPNPSAEAFLVPFEDLQGSTFTLRRADRSRFAAPLPADLVPLEVALIAAQLPR
jgi:hypothetical protein